MRAHGAWLRTKTAQPLHDAQTLAYVLLVGAVIVSQAIGLTHDELPQYSDIRAAPVEPQSSQEGFLRNAGQVADPEVRYYANLGTSLVAFKSSHVDLTIHAQTPMIPPSPGGEPIGLGRGRAMPTGGAYFTLRMFFEEAGTVDPLGIGMLDVRHHFYLGSDPYAWRSNVESYARIAYENIYPGVSAEFYVVNGDLEYDLFLQPDADLERVIVRFEGTTGLRHGPRGLVVLETPYGDVEHLVRGSRVGTRPIECESVPLAMDRLSFRCAGRWSTEILTVDPIIRVTAGGGTVNDLAKAGVVAADGSIYLTGYTDSFDFPVSPGALNSTSGRSGSVFLMKLTGSGTTLEWAAILGGDNLDIGTGIAVDPQGNVVVVGQTWSADFPLTTSPLDSTLNRSEAFISKLSGDGSRMHFSTFQGGGESDEATAVTVDDLGDIYVTGVTSSLDYPPAPTFQPGWRGYDDVFIIKLAAAGQALHYATVLSGGFSHERARDIVVDGAGNVYVAGETSSFDFPVTVTAFNTTLQGVQDVFISKLAPSGDFIVYSTFLGGGGAESVGSLLSDTFGRVYLVGSTGSEDFPVSPKVPKKEGEHADAFVARLSTDGHELEFAAVLGGGSGATYGTGIVVDASGRVTVGGRTGSMDFPSAKYLVPPEPGISLWNCFLATVDTSNFATIEAYVLGGTDEEECIEVGADASGDVYLIGNTFSEDFPRNTSIPNAHSSFWDVFVARFSIPVSVQSPETWRLWFALPVIGVLATGVIVLFLRRRRKGHQQPCIPERSKDPQ